MREHGYDELRSSTSRSLVAIAWNVLRESMFLLLLARGSLYRILGDVREALMPFGFVFVVMAITLYPERKIERALEVVRGDLVVLAEGDRRPADSAVLSCTNLGVRRVAARG